MKRFLSLATSSNKSAFKVVPAAPWSNLLCTAVFLQFDFLPLVLRCHFKRTVVLNYWRSLVPTMLLVGCIDPRIHMDI